MITQEKCGCCGDGMDKSGNPSAGFMNLICDECSANATQAVEVLEKNGMRGMHFGECGDNEAGPIL